MLTRVSNEGDKTLDYLDCELGIDSSDTPEHFLITVRSLDRDVRVTTRFPFDERQLEIVLKDLEIAILRSSGTRRVAPVVEEQAIQDFGNALFDMLLVDQARNCYYESLQKAREQGKGLRLKLCIRPPRLAALPWEFLYDPRDGEYVSLSRYTPIVRYLDLPQPASPLEVTLPLRILGVIASPKDLAPLDIEREKRHIEHAVKDLRAKGLVDLTWLAGQTWRDLQQAMRRGPWHVLHFVGHGGFDTIFLRKKSRFLFDSAKRGHFYSPN
jgi:hypothetical protein